MPLAEREINGGPVLARRRSILWTGARLFAANCAVCHGENATGTATGPPLLHRIYEPGHHPDASFRRAVEHGVMSHHWRFGHMPPVPGLSRQDIARIIAYVRELQRANGIH